MDVGTVLSVAQTLLAALQCSELKEILSIFGYKSQLADLQRTVTTINAVFRDAEIKQELNHEQQHWIEELKDAVFEADDLFDEFATLAEQKQLVEASGKLSKKVSHFFSRSHNPLSLAYRMSRGVKDIKKKLDAIARNSEQFSFKIDLEPIRKRRPETCSYVNEVDIIGRDDDLKAIVGTLLDSNNLSGVSFLTIVGIGGLGKTALAQLVYNDPRIKSAFPLRLWACVADQDQLELDVKEILCKILGQQQEGSSAMEQAQSRVREKLMGKKFLLVLDDVWNEKRDQWCEVVKYLIGGEKGSWIIVTTRSKETAKIIDGQTHNLKGLSISSSWRLFQGAAFTSDQLSNPPDVFVEIGQMIVDKCAGVPLAIRVAGSLLFGQHKSKWESVLKIGLANMEQGRNGIMPILKLSFHHLKTPLKSCFSYCALFPKDFVLKKRILISLWMAQGYIIPSDGQSIEDTGEEYFSILLRRCFFQDIEYNDKNGEIISCKIHDLMHDVAQSVAGKEIYTMNTICDNLDKKVRHLSITGGRENSKYFLGKTYIRSHLFASFFASYPRPRQFPVEALVVNCRCLRALDLSNLGKRRLPDTIGKLLHLRFLDLSGNTILEVLPNSITKLYNLQTLILSLCFKLKELPKEFSRLVKLRVLDIAFCQLRYMPRDMNSLQRLVGDYMVGGDEGSSKSRLEQWFDGLESLMDLNNLRGYLHIKFWWPRNAKSVVNKKDDRKGRLYLYGKEHLNGLVLGFSDDVEVEDDDERVMIMSLMEELQPHSNLKNLEVNKYCGVRMPDWLTLLPNLVILTISTCNELEYLPCLGNLRKLKSLRLYNLRKLEYIEALGSSAEEVSCFPSLELLVLEDLHKLKGWRRGEKDKSSSSNNQELPQIILFPCLSQLKISWCQELVNILVCPNVEDLDLYIFNGKLQIINTSTKLEEVGLASSLVSSTASPSTTFYSEVGNLDNWASSSSSCSCNNIVPKLKKLRISNTAWLNSFPMEALCCLETMITEWDDEIEELPNCMQYCTSLHTLKILFGHELKAMPNWMPKLTSLRELAFKFCLESLERRCEKDRPGEDWPYIQHIPYIDFECSISG